MGLISTPRHLYLARVLWLLVYAGLGLAAFGMALCVRPAPRLRVPTRARAALVVGAGAFVTACALVAPARLQRSSGDHAIDRVMPAFQFHEKHEMSVAATEADVMAAIRRVRADEIRLFHTLTWIRRGGRELPPGILNAGDSASIIDIATSNGFAWLHDSPREILLGTIIARPRGERDTLSPALFTTTLPSGWTLATMNFAVGPDARTPGRTRLSTETRVFANGPAARRWFAAYWRVIYPGSALIRVGWLRAIDRRARGVNRDR